MNQARIMIVEDEEIVALDIKKLLLAHGYDVIADVASGEEALRRVADGKPDLVLLDIVLRGPLDGIDIGMRIRHDHGIPVIYLTAHADEHILERAKLTEPYGYIIKPFDDRDLLTTIEIALHKHKADQQLSQREAEFRAIFDNAADAIFIHDFDGKMLDVNRTASEILEYSKGEILAMTSFDFDSPQYAPRGPERMREIKLRGHACFETAHVTKNRRVIPVEIKSRVIEFRGQSVVMSIARDITGRKSVEAELRENCEKLKKSVETTVNALASAVGIRDPYTASHQRRVTQLACAIAQRIGLEDEIVYGLRLAAIVHDIGKIYIPAEILSKPSALTDAEYDVVKSHPQIGYDILKAIDFSFPVAEIVLQHHERLNGTGYVNHLMAKDIYFEAKILGVADVAEAMLSHRPYRPAHELKPTLEELESHRGILYDGQVVDICVRLLKGNGFRFE